MKTWLAFFLLVVSTTILFSCKAEDNAVLKFLENSEIQFEGDVQKATLIEALKDVLAMDEENLRNKRYKDYAGTENQWDLQTLIYRHFVPDDQGHTLGNSFYSDLKSLSVKKKINRILIDLEM